MNLRKIIDKYYSGDGKISDEEITYVLEKLRPTERTLYEMGAVYALAHNGIRELIDAFERIQDNREITKIKAGK